MRYSCSLNAITKLNIAVENMLKGMAPTCLKNPSLVGTLHIVCAYIYNPISIIVMNTTSCTKNRRVLSYVHTVPGTG